MPESPPAEGTRELDAVSPEGGVTPIVYRRDGCGFCWRLERSLNSHDVEFETRDIWADPEAAEFVRLVNRGNETVPTVVLGDRVYTNPSPSQLLDELGVESSPGPIRRLFSRD